jgi:trehalose 6-phosphate phosphatase
VPVPTPTTPAGVRGLAAVQAAPEAALLAFDFDGVLAPIVADPDLAYADPRAVAALGRLAPRVRAMAVITGRPALVAARLGGFADHPELAGLTIFGQYGRERWDARTGRLDAPPPSPGVAAARTELPGVLAGVAEGGAAWVEEKGSALAVHTRRSRHPVALLERLRRPVTELARRHGLVVEPGRMVLELRAPGVDKGQTLRSYADGMRPGVVVYAGDDLGDLAAFAAVDELVHAGVAGLKICSGSTEVAELAGRADLVVAGPSGVAELLEQLADSLPPAG